MLTSWNRDRTGRAWPIAFGLRIWNQLDSGRTEPAGNPGCRPLTRAAVLRKLLTSLLLALIPSIYVFRAIYPKAIDNDLWWHWATGRWIIEKQAFPVADPFSAMPGKFWVAYSWLFDLGMYGLYLLMGYASAPAFVATVGTLCFVAVYMLCRQAGANHEVSAFLVLFSMMALVPLLSPRPWLISILFYVATIWVIERDRRRGEVRAMWLLPLIFLLWANLHVEFVYGLIVVFAMVADATLSRIRRRPSLPCMPVALCAGCCVLATLANPYFIGLYEVLLHLATNKGHYSAISELQPLKYTNFGDWVFLLFALAGAWSLARQPFDTFRTVLYVASAASRSLLPGSCGC